MADVPLPTLLAHNPEAAPPLRWPLLLLPVLLAIVGIVIASICATSGQQARLHVENLNIQRDIAAATAALADAQLHNEPPEKIRQLAAELEKQKHRQPISYAREFGRQFSNWDGYRYEEIVTSGYLYHQPGDPPEVVSSSHMLE